MTWKLKKMVFTLVIFISMTPCQVYNIALLFSVLFIQYYFIIFLITNQIQLFALKCLLKFCFILLPF